MQNLLTLKALHIKGFMVFGTFEKRAAGFINPLRPNNDVSQTSHCNIKGVSVSEVMRIENMITQVQCY